MLFAVISSFLLAELGDKTMLATVALASDHDGSGVWIGATIGMVLADGVAIAVGRLLHRACPSGFLHGVASLLFLLFGLWMLFDDALGWRAVAVRGHRAAPRRGRGRGRSRRSPAPRGADDGAEPRYRWNRRPNTA